MLQAADPGWGTIWGDSLLKSGHLPIWTGTGCIGHSRVQHTCSWAMANLSASVGRNRHAGHGVPTTALRLNRVDRDVVVPLLQGLFVCPCLQQLLLACRS